ncbi:MAG TPA: PEGA domain-containing protein [Thermoanaerobaculia bacterium]
MSEDLPGEPDPRRGMPAWVPVLIGAVLLIIAGLAVYTGMRYRGGPLGRAVDRATTSIMRSEGGAPGEPQPGASRVLHGGGGDYVPKPRPASADEDNASEVVIRGGPEGVIPSIRLTAQRAMHIHVDPSSAVVYVNDQPVGVAEQFTGPDLYEFPEEGEYVVRLVADGYEEIEYTVLVQQDAKTEIADIQATLKKTRTSSKAP